MSDDVLAVSYRNNAHVFPKEKIIRRDVNQGGLLTDLFGFLFAFLIVHYFMWGLAMFGFVFLVYKSGHPFIALVLILAYLPSFLRPYQFKLGRPWRFFRTNKLWWPIQRYLKVEVVRTAALDPQKQYIFGVHPHGILILSRPSVYGSVWETLFPGIELRVLGASPMFWIPGCREVCLWLESINADKQVAVKALKTPIPKSQHNQSGKLSLMVYPGGSKEIFTSDGNSKENILVARKGFVKLAIETGCNLVPGFVFGEKWKYERKFLPKPIMDFFMKTLRLPVIIFFGKFFTWIPLSRGHMTVVYGKPIPVVQSDTPTAEYIDELFEKFYAQIRELFDTHKTNLGYSKDETLTIKVEQDRKPRSVTPLE
jgi:hypothetical protein